MERDDVVIGIDFGGTKVFGALVSADGTISDESYVEHAGAKSALSAEFSPEELALGPAYLRLCELGRDLAAKARAGGRALRGVGIGAPGIIGSNGLVLAAGGLGWKAVPLGALLENRWQLPVRIENDVNLAALGEHAVGAGRGRGSLFLMAIGTGIGGASIIDGKLWRGGHFAAGEIGALIPGAEFLHWNDREWGAFESCASGTGLGNEARLAAEKAGGLLVSEALRGERLFAAAAEGVPWARQVVDRAVQLWSVAIAAVQTLIDPELVVISGGVGASAMRYMPDIQARLTRGLPQGPEIVPSTLGYRAAVLGAPSLF